MNKKQIRLTENDLKNIVKESVYDMPKEALLFRVFRVIIA